MRCVFQHKNNVRSSLQEKCPLSKVHCSNLMFKDLKRQLMRSICTGDQHYIEHHAFNILANSPQTCSLISAWHRTHPTDYWQKSRFWTLTCAKPLSLIYLTTSTHWFTFDIQYETLSSSTEHIFKAWSISNSYEVSEPLTLGNLQPQKVEIFGEHN